MQKTLRCTRRSGIDELVTINQHSNSPTCPTGMLELNPAFGCDFRCAYCGIYALEKDYFDEVIIYDDFPEYLDEYLSENHSTLSNNYFYFAAKTDCLQAPLIESGLTLRTLEVLEKHQARYFIVTKSGLPPPDIQKVLVNSKNINQLIISATMPNEELREMIEPGAAPIHERLEFAEFCLQNGIFTTASCCPILPIADRRYMLDTFRQLVSVGVTHFYFDFARLSREGIANMIELLPDRKDEFENCYFAPGAEITRWHMPHRNTTIDKYQPPIGYMLQAFQDVAECVHEVEPTATVSVCNHFARQGGLRGYNRQAGLAGISCIGHRFSG